mmetsp:Transcript_16801/g.36669  ORF Transcript_16801/g.36669 Transcript_16801/m.36669 type:complete len:106 (-) Transcript_16801:612-929(-)
MTMYFRDWKTRQRRSSSSNNNNINKTSTKFAGGIEIPSPNHRGIVVAQRPATSIPHNDVVLGRWMAFCPSRIPRQNRHEAPPTHTHTQKEKRASICEGSNEQGDA